MLRKNCFNSSERYSFILIAISPLFLMCAFFVNPFSELSYFGNDFTDHRAWWAQMDAFFLLKGYLPLWNPVNDFGDIFMGPRGGAFYYPFRWWLYPFTAMGKSWTYFSQILQICLHMSFALLGVYRLLRKHAGVSVYGAIFCCHLFILNNRFIDYIRYPNGIEVIAWTPWMIYFILNTIYDKDRVWKNSVALTLCTLMCWLAGYGHFTYITFILSGFIIIASLKQYKRAFYALASLLSGTLFSIGSLLPIYEWAMQNKNRSGNSIEWANNKNVKSYAQMFMEPFSADVHWNSFFAPALLIIILIGIGVAIIKRRSWDSKAIGMLAGLLIIIDLSRGLDGILYSFFYHYIPMFSSFRHPGRNLWVAMIPAAWFLGKGFDFIKEKKKLNWLITSFLLILCLLVLIKGVDYKSVNIGEVPGNRHNSLDLKWLSTEDAETYTVSFFIISSLLCIGAIYGSFKKNWPLVSIAILGLCFFYATLIGGFSTWMMEKKSPGLVPFDRAYGHGILGRKVPAHGDITIAEMTTTERESRTFVRKMGFDKLVFPYTKFTWIPDADNNSAVKIAVNRFSPNRIDFMIKNRGPEGTLILLSKFNSLWSCNLPVIPYTIGKQKFMAFRIDTGFNKISLTFYPLKYIISGSFTLLMVFFLFFILSDTRKKRFLTAIIGGSILFLFIYFIYNDRSLDKGTLFGVNVFNLNTFYPLKSAPPNWRY